MNTQLSEPLNQDGKGAFDLSQKKESAIDVPLAQEPQNSENVALVSLKVSPNQKRIVKPKIQEPEITFKPMSIDDLKSRVQSDLEAEVQKKRAAIMEDAEKKVGLIEDANKDALHKVDQIIGVIYETQVLCASIREIYKVLNKLSKTVRGVNRMPKKKVAAPINSKSRVKK
jgi:hypothetical protein